ncbi:hypothetical protein J7I44_03250 [Frateuria sp. MAH-13]|uniref:Uncharacterized protein n=1 Tax=Frateuria flava TaxID=2821489 RepID=A0ABS4DJQ5_9GAMM|nr:hypothetical protein [Frateuria flava]MBP1473298.1 hypothetical protein [Frateuria flava]
MTLAEELASLDNWLTRLPSVGMKALGGAGSSMYVLDWVMIGAVKRSLNLASGLTSMISAKNMVCARALLRMQLDTVTRLLGYTYVDDAELVARAVMGGKQLREFKSVDGRKLTDAYLVDRMSSSFPWVRTVYDYTSGYVHFSERQFFDAIHSLGGEDRTMNLQVSHVDNKFPESSWAEIAACFNHLLEITEEVLVRYSATKGQ